MTTDKVQILKASPLAKEMSDDEVKVLADLIDLHTVEAGEVLVPEGGTDRNLYVVVEGVIEVARRDPEGSWTVLHSLGPEELVGELSFMDDEPRYAALRAGARTTVMSLNRGRFELLLHAHPVVVYKAMRAIMRTTHAIQRRLSMQMIELTNYFFKTHGRY
jgi:CRP/FNR family cyclic AMP-dependent transcriptional regulator